MKNLLTLAFCLIFCLSCSDKKESASTNNANGKAVITNIESSKYKAVFDKSLQTTLIDRLCKESKGYNSQQWEGLNECAWAVEKFRIEQTKGLVQRVGPVLTLQLNDTIMKLEHTNGSELTPSSSYQFKGFVKKANVYYLKSYHKGQCPQYWIIDANNGTKTVLKGLPVFNSQQDAFMLSTSSRMVSQCPDELEYWQLADGKFVKKWTSKPDKSIYDLVWAEAKHWYGLVNAAEAGELSSVQISVN